jgi:glycosyltransferase involved in cell wall biosynthesis
MCHSRRNVMKLLVTIPVYNEENALPVSIPMLHAFLSEHMADYDWVIEIADNASIDRTAEVSRTLIGEYERVRYLRLEQKGRGRALKKSWTESDADIVSYMDVDLSTNLDSFPPMVRALSHEGYDIGTGSRLMKGANTVRSLKREVISRTYNIMVKAMFFTRFSDAQCGFKAVTREVIETLIPHVEDNVWFFDSELLIIGEKSGYRIFDVPVKWIEDLDTRVKIVKTAIDDIKGLLRVRKNFWTGKYARLKKQS